MQQDSGSASDEENDVRDRSPKIQGFAWHRLLSHAGIAKFFDMAEGWFKGLPSRVLSPILTLTPSQDAVAQAKEPIMATLTISLSDEEMRRLEALGERENLTVEQMVRLSIHDFINQPDDAFRAAAKRVMEKNAELYRRLS